MNDFRKLKELAEKKNKCIEFEDLIEYEFNDELLNFLFENNINFNDTNGYNKGLTAEQEKHLFMSLEYAKYMGDTCRATIIQNTIINCYLALVGKLATNYLHWEEYNDLFNQGLIGLINAINHFNFRLGTRLITYAYKSIKNELQDYMHNYYLRTMPVGVPRRNINAFYSDIKMLSDISHDFYIVNGKQPTDEYLADILNCDIGKIQSLKCAIEAGPTTVSYDATISENNDGMAITYKNCSALKDKTNVEDLAINANPSDLLQNALSQLSEREQFVIINHYGINGAKILTLSVISQNLSISPEWARQLENKAMTKIKDYFSSLGYEKLYDFLGGNEIN